MRRVRRCCRRSCSRPAATRATTGDPQIRLCAPSHNVQPRSSRRSMTRSRRIAPADQRSRWSSWTRGEVDTSVEMRYPMFLMHISEFLRLGILEPHQVLRDAGKLVKWAPHMKHVIFLSHQWTSFRHPDPSLEQLRVVQRVMLRMMAGNVPATAPAFADAVYLPKGASISPKEWAKVVPDAYIWMECAAAAPQPDPLAAPPHAALRQTASPAPPAVTSRCLKSASTTVALSTK